MNGKYGIEAMRVQESVKCAKMTEDRSKNGVSEIASGKMGLKSLGEGAVASANGAVSPKLTLSAESDSSRGPGGGRLQFFKNGKFILELSHRKEGEKASWVPVPKKTFWPPPGGGGAMLPAAASAVRQESSASLSVSDDNSSVQSSPWQRDHCWKQTTPRRGLSQELMFFMRPRKTTLWLRRHAMLVVRKKRRRPLDGADVVWNGQGDMPARLKGIARTRKGRLAAIIERLKTSALETNCKPVVPSSSKLDPWIISPRKRILREFERVSLEDHASKRHKRPSALVKSPSPPSVASCSNSHVSAVKTKGSFSVPSPTPSPPSSAGCSNSPSPASSYAIKPKIEKLGSYSITSLLAKSESDNVPSEPSFLRSLLKSPSRTPGGSDLVSVAGMPCVVSQPLQSPPEVKWKHHKKKLSQASPSPPDTHRGMRLSTAPLPHHIPSTPFLSPPAPVFNNFPNFLSPHPQQPPLVPSHFYPFYPRGHLWTHPINYAGLMPLGEPWANPPMVPPPPQQQLLVDPVKREDLATDMPLNLSKHAG